MCYFYICHPTWHKGWMRRIQDKSKTEPFDWRTETYNVHPNAPDPVSSLESPEALKNGNDMYAEIGNHILKMSGRLDILEFKPEKG